MKEIYFNFLMIVLGTFLFQARETKSSCYWQYILIRTYNTYIYIIISSGS